MFWGYESSPFELDKIIHKIVSVFFSKWIGQDINKQISADKQNSAECLTEYL